MQCNAMKKWTKESDIGLLVFYEGMMNERYVAVSTVMGSRIRGCLYSCIWQSLSYVSHNNDNNNNPISKAPECQKTSVALSLRFHLIPYIVYQCSSYGNYFWSCPFPSAVMSCTGQGDHCRGTVKCLDISPTLSAALLHCASKKCPT